MTRQRLLQLLAGAPLAAVPCRITPAAGDGEMRLHLGPGRYTIGAGGGISVFDHGVRIEGCSFEGCSVRIADSKDAAFPTPLA